MVLGLLLIPLWYRRPPSRGVAKKKKIFGRCIPMAMPADPYRGMRQLLMKLDIDNNEVEHRTTLETEAAIEENSRFRDFEEILTCREFSENWTLGHLDDDVARLDIFFQIGNSLYFFAISHLPHQPPPARIDPGRSFQLAHLVQKIEIFLLENSINEYRIFAEIDVLITWY